MPSNEYMKAKTVQMAIAASTGHLLVQPFARRKAVMATPPTIDTANIRRNDGISIVHSRNTRQKGSSMMGIDQFQKFTKLVISMKRFQLRSGMGLLFR